MIGTLSRFSLTQDCFLHGFTPTIYNLLPMDDIDKYILNLSLETLNNHEKAFDNVLSFLDMVNFIIVALIFSLEISKMIQVFIAILSMETYVYIILVS